MGRECRTRRYQVGQAARLEPQYYSLKIALILVLIDKKLFFKLNIAKRKNFSTESCYGKHITSIQ